jgi:hypothetical protein
MPLQESKWGTTIYGMYCRYRNKIENTEKVSGANSVSLVEYYNRDKVDYKTYCSVIREFNSKLADALIMDALEFTMPFRLGKVRIKKFKQKIKLDENGEIDKKNLPVNYAKTWKMWFDTYPGLTREEIKQIPGTKVIFHLNEHTSGYRCVLFWDRLSCNVKNNRVYSIMFTFTNRRKLASMLKTDCKINYYE